jgi:UDP-N-acetylglucosamine acyltransferase
MPGVLLMESLAQAAGIWLLNSAADPRQIEVHVVGIDDAKFRRPAVPGDELVLEVRVLHRRGSLCRVRGEVRVGDHRVAEARLLLRVVTLPPPQVDPTARVAPEAVLGPGVRIGPYCIVGPHVRIGADTVLESHVVLGGHTVLGSGNRLFPFCSVGLVPQDLKYRGEATRLEVGDRNTFREFVTVHIGTAGGGGLTRIGSDNLLQAHAHVAHDCTVGSHTILAHGATLGGHVDVADHATVGAFSGVHQFCRVGLHAFLGGFSVATKDVLPYSKTVGNRACIYGINSVGLTRRGFSAEALRDLRRAYRVLLQSRLNASDALRRLELEGPHTEEVRVLVEFIRSSERGVILKRRPRSRSASEEGA